MKIVILKLAALMAVALLTPSLAHGADEPQPQEADVEVHDFTLQEGQRLPILKLHYTTLGTPKRDASGKVINAVVLLHGTTQTSKVFLAPTLANNLFKPDQPLDANRFYIVLPDGIGAGGSTKPSDGLRARFPHYGYIDQVEAQYAMLMGMGIDHVKLVAGISQGGMQTWLWGERHPEFMNALVPIASLPVQISGRNLIWRQIIIRAIRNDPDWHGGDYDPAHAPTLWMQTAAPLFTMMGLNPEKLQAAGPDRAKTLAFYDQLVAQYRGRDANDYLYDFESSSDYDPAHDVGKIKARLLAISFSDDEVNPPQFSDLQQTIARLPSARLATLPGGDAGYGHLGIFHAEMWAKEVGDYLDQVPGWKETSK
jgi:homoserine O-acetyltransferase